MTHRHIHVGFLLAAGLSIGGCAAVPVATLTAAAGAAASATEVTSAVFRLGKLRAAEMATVPRVRAAVEAAAADLSLEISEIRESDGRRIVYVLCDSENQTIVISIRRRTETMSRLQIDVGLFGAQEIARLIYERIKVHLRRSDPEAHAAGAAEGSDVGVALSADDFPPADVWPQRLGNAHGSILLLVDFEDGDEDARAGEDGVVQRVAEVGLALG